MDGRVIVANDAFVCAYSISQRVETVTVNNIKVFQAMEQGSWTVYLAFGQYAFSFVMGNQPQSTAQPEVAKFVQALTLRLSQL